MDFKQQKLILIAGMVFLTISSILLGWLLSFPMIHLSILMGVVIVVGFVFLYNKLTRFMREVLFFFRALENDDTSINYRSAHRSRYIDELHQHLNRMNENYRKIRLSNEMREQYFSRILEHLSSGILVLSQSGHINHINDEALRLLSMPQLTHIRALSKLYPGLHRKIGEMNSLDRAELELQDRESGFKRMLGLQIVDIKLKGEDVRVLTLHDLSAGMERKEIDDWIRLIRVMSHEIMNSLAPITSISNTLKELWAEYDSYRGGGETDEITIQKTLKGLDAIAEQSEGLTTFFESYRVLSRIPDPVIKEFKVCSMMEKLEILVSNMQENTRVKLCFTCDNPRLKLLADEQMIMQVMLNLVKNAVQAVEKTEDAEITVSVLPGSKHIVLEVSDNGEGISPEISAEIFMPFFTTREKGTGVGLSYSRQVMAMNGGRIEFNSQPGSTQFRLIF